MKKQLILTTIISLSASSFTFAETGASPLEPEKVKKLTPDYKVTASGLKYRVIKAGKGVKPTIKSAVKVHYEGKLESNGFVFDSSIKRGKPASFPLKGVIKGWQEGLQLMETGSTYEFIIPPELAYGKKGSGHFIPGNSTLIFEVRLIKVGRVGK